MEALIAYWREALLAILIVAFAASCCGGALWQRMRRNGCAAPSPTDSQTRPASSGPPTSRSSSERKSRRWKRSFIRLTSSGHGSGGDGNNGSDAATLGAAEKQSGSARWRRSDTSVSADGIGRHPPQMKLPTRPDDSSADGPTRTHGEARGVTSTSRFEQGRMAGMSDRPGCQTPSRRMNEPHACCTARGNWTSLAADQIRSYSAGYPGAGGKTTSRGGDGVDVDAEVARILSHPRRPDSVNPTWERSRSLAQGAGGFAVYQNPDTEC